VLSQLKKLRVGDKESEDTTAADVHFLRPFYSTSTLGAIFLSC